MIDEIWDECEKCGEIGNWEHIPAQPERADEPGCDETWVCNNCGAMVSE